MKVIDTVNRKNGYTENPYNSPLKGRPQTTMSAASMTSARKRTFKPALLSPEKPSPSNGKFQRHCVNHYQDSACGKGKVDHLTVDRSKCCCPHSRSPSPSLNLSSRRSPQAQTSPRKK